MTLSAEDVIDDEIRQLLELKKMAANPRMVEIMKKIATDSNGNQPPTTSDFSSIPPSAKAPVKINRRAPKKHSPNGLADVVSKTAESFGSQEYTIPAIVEKMEAAQYAFTAKDHRVAVSQAFKRLVKRRRAVLVSKGDGNANTPYVYKNAP